LRARKRCRACAGLLASAGSGSAERGSAPAPRPQGQRDVVACARASPVLQRCHQPIIGSQRDRDSRRTPSATRPACRPAAAPGPVPSRSAPRAGAAGQVSRPGRWVWPWIISGRRGASHWRTGASASA
jgi:hypothetical protein